MRKLNTSSRRQQTINEAKVTKAVLGVMKIRHVDVDYGCYVLCSSQISCTHEVFCRRCKGREVDKREKDTPLLIASTTGVNVVVVKMRKRFTIK